MKCRIIKHTPEEFEMHDPFIGHTLVITEKTTPEEAQDFCDRLNKLYVKMVEEEESGKKYMENIVRLWEIEAEMEDYENG